MLPARISGIEFPESGLQLFLKIYSTVTNTTNPHSLSLLENYSFIPAVEEKVRSRSNKGTS